MTGGGEERGRGSTDKERIHPLTHKSSQGILCHILLRYAFVSHRFACEGRERVREKRDSPAFVPAYICTFFFVLWKGRKGRRERGR